MPSVGTMIRERLQPIMSSHRLLLYAAVSILAIAATTLNAMKTYNNFYSVAIHLTRSGRSLLILANFGIFLAFASGRILQKILFGPLLPAEVERLYDRVWFFVTESLLAFTIFRDDFDVQFGIMFGFLLFVKCFHWLLSDRIEWMDQRPYPGPPPLFHIRALSLFVLLGLTDSLMLAYTVESTLRYGVGATVLFANEYAILLASLTNAMAKYTLSIVELRRASSRGGANAPPWEAKSTYIFYVELLTDFFKLSTYLAFFVVIITFYGLPLNIIRDVYMTGHSFITRLTAFYRYRTATRDMDHRYPNATAEELSGEADQTCIICREEMVAPAPDAAAPVPADGPNMTPKKLPCGHIFHFHCLRSWLERQQNCPTCRRTVLETGAAGTAGPGQPPNNGLAQAGGFGQGAGINGRPDEQGAIARAVARIFGPPPPRRLNGPRVLPALGPNGEIPFPMGPPRAPAAAAAAPGAIPTLTQGQATQRPPSLVFEYNYVWDPNTRAPVLMQPPMLQGFYREDGLWQAWPGGAEQPPMTPGPGTVTTTRTQTPRLNVADDAQLAARLAVPNRTDRSATTAPARPSPLSRSTSAHPSDEESEKETGKPASPKLASDSPATAPAPVSRPMTARDAAAAAALRRFEGPSSPGPVQSSPSVPQPSSQTPTFSTAGPSAVGTASGVVTTPSTASALTASKPTPTASIPPPSAATALPTTIPLYDFGRPLANQARPPLTKEALSSLPSIRIPGVARTMERVTDEQLARLDALTREAIDERLRILEDVSATANRCAEQLLRVRSVLPAATAQIAQVQVTQPTPPLSSADVKSKGKGVDPSERGGSISTTETRPLSSSPNAEAPAMNAPAANYGPDPIQPAAAAGGENLAASVASQLAALASLTSASAQSEFVQPESVPLAVVDPAFAEQVEEASEAPAMPNVGGQEAEREDGSETSDSDEDHT